MARTPGACLICGKPLQYFPREREMTCSLCGQTFPSRASCEDGHFVCDSCHARRGGRSFWTTAAGAPSGTPSAWPRR